MPVIPIGARRQGECVRLELALPGRPVHTVGVLLLDPDTGRLYRRLRSHWDDLADPEDAEVLAALEQDLEARSVEMGGRRLLESLEDSLSHTLRLSEREAVAVDSFSRTADRLFERHVEKLPVAPFVTHLPLYSLRAAATRFGEDEPVGEEDWVRAPEHLLLTPNHFVAHVVGRSMEPRIPDGSLNIFRAPVVGSRQNKIVLVELQGVLEETARYTVKKYTSRKVFSGEEQWEHGSIRLEPLNREFQPLDLEPDRLRVIAEWICTLE
ncbi:MAG TPA: S24 family peptidase [Bryobacteraceae bacterium]|nr:S24 family peptidase [Bryobacteraceae bacterium]